MAYSDKDRERNAARERMRRMRSKGVTGGDVTPADVTPFMKPDVTPVVTYIDLVKDLGLDLGKDLGLTGWDCNGAHLRDDVTIGQVRRIRGIVEAKHGWSHRVYA